MPKALKHDLGQETFQSAIRMLKWVVIANASKEKAPPLGRLLIEIDVQWALLRLLFDLGGITEGEFKVLSERLDDIGKQTQGWISWDRTSSKKSP